MGLAEQTEGGEPTESEADPVAGASGDVAEKRGRELRHVLEALLLVVDVPATESQLAYAADAPIEEISTELRRWQSELDGESSGMDLRATAEGWRLYTRRDYSDAVERLILEGSRAKLSRAALETLAVIAYRQPVTRSRIAAVRGVNVDGVVRTLSTRGLVVEAGNDPDSGGILYRTTELFLDRLGLSGIEELPDIAPLLPDVDVVDEFSDDPEDDPRSPLSRRQRRDVESAGASDDVLEATEPHDEN
ncbi:SMC-Scp complex subunit ScpB [Dietzia sp.]|uniref:SMC-Scp complex subunit ScpB n=1 Tax=Dietzia sp. TaxID=1871616 RepID=UPI002FD9560E